MNDTTSGENVLDMTTAQVVPLGVFCFFMALFGILGNGVVLYSSLRYNAIKLDKVSLVFVRNLALADILYAVFTVVPSFVAYASRDWVLGPVYCFVSAQLSLFPGLVNSLLVMIIALYRLVLLYSPFTIPRCIHARVLSAGLWLFSLSPTIISLSYRSRSIFDTSNGLCISEIYRKKDSGASELVMMFVSVCIMLPILIILVANLALCWAVVRLTTTTGSRNKSVIMTCALAGTFLVSWAPFVAYNVMEQTTDNIPQDLYIASFVCIFLNTAANPILYTLTNRRFSRYVVGLIQLKWARAKSVSFVYNRANTSSTST